MKEEEDVEISNLPVRFLLRDKRTKSYVEFKIEKRLFEKDEV